MFQLVGTGPEAPGIAHVQLLFSASIMGKITPILPKEGTRNLGSLLGRLRGAPSIPKHTEGGWEERRLLQSSLQTVRMYSAGG